MGFCRLTCAPCNGAGYIKGTPIPGVVHHTTCTNCNGEGSILTHTGAIGSYVISVDPASKPGDETWASLWERHDDGTLELKDSGIIPGVSQ